MDVEENANTVRYLQKINFTKLPLTKQLEIKRIGRVMPDLTICQSAKSRAKEYLRKFKFDVYKKHKWLTGCTKTNAVFCFPCLLYKGDSRWVKKGVSNLNRLSSRMKQHERSALHLKNAFQLHMLGVSMPDVGAEGSEGRQHNENVKKNREILSRIIDCVKFCGKHEAVSGGGEDGGLLGGLLEFAGKLDGCLASYFANSPVFKDNLKKIENELLSCILGVCQSVISSQIQNAKFLCVMVEDLSDISEHDEQAIVFRYEHDGTVIERLWGLFSFPDSIPEQLDVVLRGENHKLIAQTYDGACDVFRDSIPSVVQNSFKNAHFLPCCANRLGLIIQKTASLSQQPRVFFSSLAAIPAFFSASPSRMSILDAYSVNKDVNTTWDFDNRVVNTVLENKQLLKECLETLESDKNAKTVAGAVCLLRTLNDQDFDFWLRFFNEIMLHVENVESELTHCNALSLSKVVKEFVEVVTEMKNQLPADTLEEDFPPTKTEKSSKSNFSSAKEVCDNIVCQIMERFSFAKHLSAVKLFSPDLFQEGNTESSFPSIELEETIEAYPFLNKELLATELRVLYDREEFRNMSGFTEVYRTLLLTGLSDIFVETFTLLQVLITTPTNAAECFSTLRKVRNFMKRSTFHDSLSALCMLSVEKNLIDSIPQFNEKVIEEFVSHQEEPKDFLYV